MTHIKLYFQGVALLIVMIIIVGLFVPCLLSADDMILPFIGLILILSVPPVIWLFYRHAIKILEEEKEHEQLRKENRAANARRGRGVQ